MKRAEAIAELCAGAGVGIVVGIIMGLSASPVVGTVLGSISAGLLALLGFKTGTFNALSSFRVAAFGLACVSGIFAGIAVRTHSWLSPDLQKEVSRWTAAGFTSQQAQQLVLFERTGVLQKDWISTEKSVGSTSLSVLFATKSADDCGYFTSARYPEIGAQLDAFAQKGGEFAKMARIVRQLPEAAQRQVLDTSLELRCGK